MSDVWGRKSLDQEASGLDPNNQWVRGQVEAFLNIQTDQLLTQDVGSYSRVKSLAEYHHYILANLLWQATPAGVA